MSAVLGPGSSKLPFPKEAGSSEHRSKACLCGNWTACRKAEGGRAYRSPVTQRMLLLGIPFVTFSMYISYVPAFHERVFNVSNLEVIILKSYMLYALSFHVFTVVNCSPTHFWSWIFFPPLFLFIVAWLSTLSINLFPCSLFM